MTEPLMGIAAAIMREKLMKANLRSGLTAIILIVLAQPASADVISDWNENAVTFAVATEMPADAVAPLAFNCFVNTR